MHGMNEMSPEELFNMFFMGGGGMGGGMGGNRSGFRSYTFHTGPGAGFRPAGARQERPMQESTPNLLNQLFQILPIVILFLMSFSSFGSYSSSPPFFLSPYGSHVFRRMTKASNYVSPDIPYYVDSTFESKYEINRELIRKIEKQVEMDYKENLNIKCLNEREFHRRKAVSQFQSIDCCR